MKSRVLAVLLLLAAAAFGISTHRAVAATDIQRATVPPRMVMTWVPPYDLATSYTQIRKLYSGTGPRNSITHLALQFWVPAPDGGLDRASSAGTISDTVIRQYVAFAHANGFKVMLCVYNGDGANWDWPLARNAFVNNRTKFINELVAEMQKFRLDGIDVDLEGPDYLYPNVHNDKGVYITFIRALATRVHAVGKVITLDSFPYQWNGPNWSWWPALFPLVDGITSMGYAEIGRNAATWAKYAAQKAHASTNSAKLMLGVPSDVNAWQGNTALDQVKWFRTAGAGRVGVAIWDVRNLGAAWRRLDIWSELRAIREQP